MNDVFLSDVDANLDLVLDRTVDVPVDFVWAAWTEPERLKKWFTPKPWQTVDCEIDLKPGGTFRTVMRSPEGQDFSNIGCYLDVVPRRRLVWTSALGPGFRPVAAAKSVESDETCGTLLFTAVLTLTPEGQGTRYVATVFHPDAESSARHEAMGFYDGWSATLDQLVALYKSEAA